MSHVFTSRRPDTIEEDPPCLLPSDLSTFGTLPGIFVMQYLQAQHLDTDFDDRYYKDGAYLETHARHMHNWHGGGTG